MKPRDFRGFLFYGNRCTIRKTIGFKETVRKILRIRNSMSSFVVIYGRRRTGKTTLINQFLKNKKSLYRFANTQNERGQIKCFQDQLAVL